PRPARAVTAGIAAVRPARPAADPRPADRNLEQLGAVRRPGRGHFPLALGEQLHQPVAPGPCVAAADDPDGLVRQARVLGTLRLPRSAAHLVLPRPRSTHAR